ncbi:MAG: hypothetical protein WD079_07740, partial [Phycisphaeraceae bacterium]
MDVRRVRRGDSVLYTLVLFVFLFVITAALAVVFYMQAEEQRVQADQASSSLNEVASSQDRGSDLYATMQSRSTPTVFAALRNELEGLRSLIVGEADASREAIASRLANVGAGEGDVLVHVLTDMTNELQRLEGQLESAVVSARAAEQQLDDLQEQAGTTQEAHEAQVAELTAAVDSLNNDYEAFREQVASQRGELSRRLEQARDEAEQEIRQRDNQISQMEGQLVQRDSRIRQLIQELGGETPEVPDVTRESDGRIVSVSTERNVAYIDLGRRHRMVLGMRFEVFDRVRGVEVGEDGELRGKATIEIVDISDTSAAGRIVRASSAQPVLPGDPIANLVYDRERQFKFFVFGDFDLDNDENYSVADRETVLTLVREWGGTVVDPEQRRDQLSARFDSELADNQPVPPDVDFVVVGREPRMPPELAPGERDPVRIQQAVRAEENWQQYQTIVAAARELGIPILN